MSKILKIKLFTYVIKCYSDEQFDRFIFAEMLFSRTFEIGLLVLGFLYVCHLFFKDVIALINITNDIEASNAQKVKDEELKNLTTHLYS